MSQSCVAAVRSQTSSHSSALITGTSQTHKWWTARDAKSEIFFPPEISKLTSFCLIIKYSNERPGLWKSLNYLRISKDLTFSFEYLIIKKNVVIIFFCHHAGKEGSHYQGQCVGGGREWSHSLAHNASHSSGLGRRL